MGRWEEQRSSPSVDLLVPARVWGGVAESREWSCRKRRRPSIAVDVLSKLSSIHRSMASNDVLTFVKGHSDAEMMESGKVRCLVTGHEMPARLDAIQQHFNGKRYKNAKARAKYDFKKHEPWIVEHKRIRIFSTAPSPSSQSQNKRAVEGHINGKKYKRLLAEALNPTEKKPSKKALAREAASMKRGVAMPSTTEKTSKTSERKNLRTTTMVWTPAARPMIRQVTTATRRSFSRRAVLGSAKATARMRMMMMRLTMTKMARRRTTTTRRKMTGLTPMKAGQSAARVTTMFLDSPKIAVVGSKSGADLDALNKPNKRQRGDDGSRRKAPVNTELTPRELKPNKRELKSKMRHRGSMDGEADGEKQPRPLTASPNLASVSAKQAMAVPLMALQGEAEKPLKKAKTGQIVKGGMKAHKGRGRRAWLEYCCMDSETGRREVRRCAEDENST